MPRVIIYGDIHGCLDELEQLREVLNPDENDIEVSVGDFLNKGPKSQQTLRYLIEHNILAVMGNNEAKIIKLYKKYQAEGEAFLETLRPSDKETLLSLECDDINYLESLPYFIKFDTITVVHGGIVNGMKLTDDMSSKDKKLLTQLRFFDKKDKPLPYEDFEHRDKFWSEVYDGSEGFVIFGHHPFEEVKIEKYAIGIDTGCVYGGKLTSISFQYEDGKIDTSKYTLNRIKALPEHFRLVSLV